MDAVHAETTCYRHPRRAAFVRCSRCDRYICADCMREAPVGQRCPDCVKGDNRTVRPARSVFGGRVGGTPWVTYAVIALNVAAYLVELVQPAVIDRFDVLGAGLLGADGQYYVDEGDFGPAYQPAGVLHGEWYRLITSAFLHLPPGETGFGLAHIVFNMMWIWTLGRFLEEKLGWARYLALYLLAAAGGSLLVVLVDPAQTAIGASGAGFGLAAAYFVLTRKLHDYPIDRNRLIVLCLIWLVLSSGFASWEGHLGGLLTGGSVALGLAYAPSRHRSALQAAFLAAVTLVLVLAVVAATLSR